MIKEKIKEILFYISIVGFLFLLLFLMKNIPEDNVLHVTEQYILNDGSILVYYYEDGYLTTGFTSEYHENNTIKKDEIFKTRGECLCSEE